MIKVISITNDASPTWAVATVRFTFYPIYNLPIEELTADQIMQNTLLLVKQDNGWRVHDILTPEFSFLGALAE